MGVELRSLYQLFLHSLEGLFKTRFILVALHRACHPYHPAWDPYLGELQPSVDLPLWVGEDWELRHAAGLPVKGQRALSEG